MAGRKGLSEEDLRLWAAYGRTLTRLMPGRTRLPLAPEPPADPPPSPAPAAPPLPRLAQPPPHLGLNAAPGGLDKSTWKQFRTGRIRAEARLDLHGHTAARAHHEVLHFLERAHAAQLRCVEIITGKGEILARELPHWLNAPGLRPRILALTHPHAANTGSVRILLRRVRA
ncbi:Smr/MutS family protein [Acidocella sp. KAb 2-4]|uniref:Smr/MutS family protein n=1 Tax=Acidocella sp. KAb 2-4 TaxID=2885158 RepID=UPI001D094227|nr:Smr/MutS family protein [Acidocella sp. KAb 2-4]MCB5945525.1 Smr/MutS family protein [Acidocella sp. KAb 2-4]